MRRRRVLGLASAAFSLAASPQLRAESGFDVQPWPANKAAPQQLRADETASPWTLADFRGRAILINFWASWCEPCRQEMPSLQQLSMSRATELQVLTVNVKDARSNLELFISQTGLQLPVMRDVEGVIARQWGIRIFPSTVLMDAEGHVRSTVRGAIDWSGPAARELIRPLLRRVPAGAG